ncbi:Carbonate dehydratase beta type [Alkalihalophilus pseudofirmus OF4]|uniref:carbonic anhydrase n=2 Tax=Alkalihalophilus pseudofirmus TaxID=79885 RepID=D3FXY7_ALKPO|nr:MULTISPECIES: carbonic anhydrase [Alkalihalophilus]ADC50746.1 Carbonate dehydratase beta type [Alkalihalophilus pseudofirmus OF4]MDV2883944.1 carbonic anhydrase [Alkalihalophilus pseudofirmus]MED1602509.1 carbonic anhydrase [Alkalihalophilus marmarensis]WEG17976.1 carbonic anhydrase [Alkalihalophilus pseudofirmus]
MEKKQLQHQNETFLKEMREQDPHFFEKLKEGQQPEMFVLACSDSRVSPSVITNMPLGKMFIHRNIANQVNVADESFTASLYYALKHLKVADILILGHTSCGGVRAAAEGNTEDALAPWLASVRESLGGAACEGLGEAASIKNVKTQMERLEKHPVYQQYGQGVSIVGAVFHVESGEIEWMN